MQNVDQTILAQYANSPTLVSLIESMNDAIDPSADIDNFYHDIFDISTCGDYGLDCWGKIVGVSRLLQVSTAGSFFGFRGSDGVPFGQAPFDGRENNTSTYRLPTESYRKLILVKAIANITDCTISSLNKLVSYLFVDRGRCYVINLGGMEMLYRFEFLLTPVDKSILANSGAIPRPAGVLCRFDEIIEASTFGFRGSDGQPFNQGVFDTKENLYAI